MFWRAKVHKFSWTSSNEDTSPQFVSYDQQETYADETFTDSTETPLNGLSEYAFATWVRWFHNYPKIVPLSKWHSIMRLTSNSNH